MTRLFSWNSATLANYGAGHIIAAAVSVEEARAAVEADLERLFDYHKDTPWVRNLREQGDEDSIAEREQWMNDIRREVSTDPDETARVLMISGSE